MSKWIQVTAQRSNYCITVNVDKIIAIAEPRKIIFVDGESVDVEESYGQLVEMIKEEG